MLRFDSSFRRSSEASRTFVRSLGSRHLLVLIVATLLASPAWAKSPVEFDVPATVAVSHVTSADYAAVSSTEKLVAIRLQVSTYLTPHSTTDVTDVVVTFDSPATNFQVVDFFPKTTLDTKFAGPVAVQTTDDRRLGIDFDATGLYKSLTGMSLTGKIGDAHTRSEDYQLLPPQEVVSSSGTIHRGRGAYFKLHSSTNGTVEGAKDFLIVARVPHTWRGDLARLRCTAGGEQRESFLALEETGALAQNNFLLGLYLEGDAAAQSAAESFVAAEQTLRRTAREQRRAIEQRSSPKMLQKIGLSKPAVSSDWLSDWLYGQAQRDVASRLPPPVRQAALQYTTARAELHRLSGE